MHIQIETERKYLIRMPDEGMLSRLPGCELWEIDQTYLMDGAQGETRRVRRVRCREHIRYYYTQKRHISALSNREEEEEIGPERYAALLQEANPSLRTICKRRYRIPYNHQLLEIDIYTFWADRATLEIELKAENQAVELPQYLQVVRELTGERAYKNRYLAEHVPMEVLN